MYKIIIDRGETYLFVDNGTEEINEKKDLIGFLVNTENIIDLIKNLPVSKYYVKDLDGSNKSVSENQAIWLYQQLIGLQNSKFDNINKEHCSYKKTKKVLKK